jgi:hypothetical protein
MIKKLERALQMGHDLYTFDEIMDGIYAGKFQSFAHGDTWCVTRVYDFPRKRVLDIFLVVGNIGEFHILEEQVTEYAKGIGANKMTATGRLGFEGYLDRGWKKTAVVYDKELDDG